MLSGEKSRILALALLMALIVILAVTMTAAALYRVALHEEKGRLQEAVESQAHLMGAIAEHERVHRSKGTNINADNSLLDHTLEIVRIAHGEFKGFGETGEFTLGRREGANIVFLLRHRHYDLDKPISIPFSSNLGEPMYRALSGKSGVDICLDYRGERVVAAYEPVPKLDLGLVAKIDLAEVRAPFIEAGLLIGASSLVLIGAGIFLFLRIGNPIVRRLEENERKYRTLSEDLDKEVKRKVSELQQAEHMAAIGRMVSVVSHEMRNPLQHIRLGIETLQMYVGDDRDKTEIMEEIQHGITILDQIVEELLEYSRRVSLNYSSVQYGALVKQTLSSLSHKLDGIAVHVELEREEKEIAIDPVKIGQVLVNVISNGIEAMNSGGNIRISSKFLNKLDGREHLEISISDNGSGMSEETLKRIEEPFFTTKISGTGLGMPICRKIIDAHKGSLNVRSKQGDGTTVVITLPVQNDAQSDTRAGTGG